MLEDQQIASQLKIDTNDKGAGDVYLVRPASQFNLTKSNAKLCGYDYSTIKILTSDEILKDSSGSVTYAKILEHAFNSPIVVRDYMQFAVLSQKFKTNALVVYCDPEADPAFYRKVLKTLV
jgi:outer membrane usher protein FimD/PapC